MERRALRACTAVSGACVLRLGTMIEEGGGSEAGSAGTPEGVLRPAQSASVARGVLDGA